MAADSPVAMLNAMLQPWRDSVENPAAAQQAALQRLLADYAKTDFGRQHHAADIGTIAEYRNQFLGQVVPYNSQSALLCAGLRRAARFSRCILLVC